MLLGAERYAVVILRYTMVSFPVTLVISVTLSVDIEY